MLAGQVLIGLILWYLMMGKANQSELYPGYKWIAPVAVLGCIAVSFLLGNKHREGIPALTKLDEKLDHFRRTSIVRYALVEGGNLIAVLLAFMSSDDSLLLWFALGIAAFVLLRPSLDDFAGRYSLSDSERASLESS
jgi:hypothetical protein